jgi:hypothetical protein
MIGLARKWKELRELLAAYQPQVRIDRAAVTQAQNGQYDVVIEGFGLRPSVTPPAITVGGAPVEQLKFESGGRRVTGVLRARPVDDHVIVDLGYARAIGRAG